MNGTATSMARFPRLAAYVEQLPQGLDSFPECCAKASIHRKVHEFAAQPLTDLPEPLQALLDEPPPPSTWVPQCHTLALVIALVESRGLSPRDESIWVRRAATHLFASTMYRILMWAATPGMVFKTANLRWRAFFRGSWLSSTVAERTASVRLHAPERLFHADLAGIFADVMSAAVNYTREPEARASLELVGIGTEGIDYRGRW